jgi:catechol 2,3-dioxygenase-like lactoylglutathione lyase family enzyme
MAINKLAHFSVRTTDIEASRKFYVEVLGFRVGFRPPFQFPGLWLYQGEDE